MMTGSRRWFAAVLAGCGMLRCACLWDPDTGLRFRGCPCKRSGQCSSGRCVKGSCK